MTPRFLYNGSMRDTFLPFCRPSISEEDIAAIGDVLRSGWITTGPKVAALEDAVAKRCGAKHAIAATSGTALMHLALQAMGVGPGDEVVGPSMTWVSTPNMVELLGGTNVFVDADRDTLLASPEAIAAERLAARYGPETQILTTAQEGAIRCHINPDGQLQIDPFRKSAHRGQSRTGRDARRK